MLILRNINYFVKSYVKVTLFEDFSDKYFDSSMPILIKASSRVFISKVIYVLDENQIIYLVFQ